MGDVIDLEVASAQRAAKTRQKIIMGDSVGPGYCEFQPLPQKFADLFLHVALPGSKDGVDGYMMLKFKEDELDAAKAIEVRFIKAAFLKMHYGEPKAETSRDLTSTFNDAAFKPAPLKPGQTIALVKNTIEAVCKIKHPGGNPFPTEDEIFGRCQIVVFYNGLTKLDAMDKTNAPKNLRYLGKDGTLTLLNPAHDDFVHKPLSYG